jgi:hypothetical protein
VRYSSYPCGLDCACGQYCMCRVCSLWRVPLVSFMRVQVFACGNSNEGKLGQGEDKLDASVHEPRRVVGLEDVTPVRVVAGAFHTLVLTSTGTVRAPLHDSSTPSLRIRRLVADADQYYSALFVRVRSQRAAGLRRRHEPLGCHSDHWPLWFTPRRSLSLFSLAVHHCTRTTAHDQRHT